MGWCKKVEGGSIEGKCQGRVLLENSKGHCNHCYGRKTRLEVPFTIGMHVDDLNRYCMSL